MPARKRAPSFEGAAPNKIGARNGLAPEHVIEIQRARMLSAMSEVCAERGAANVSVAHVVDRAGVSRRTFYEIFSGREDCFLAAFEDAIRRMGQRVIPVYEQPGKWRERIRASLIELLSFLDDDPGMGRLAIVEALGAGHSAFERRGHVLAQVISAIDEGRSEAREGSEPTRLTAEGVVGAVLGVLHTRLLQADRGPFIELTGPLMGMIVLPYLGPSASRRELSRPVPRVSEDSRRIATDPLRELQMRLTYRTVRVLMAVAAHPGSSNRAVGEAAGIPDQGQISKLLARLSRLGLIENTIGGSSGRGAPNAWVLSAKGREVAQSISEASGG